MASPWVAKQLVRFRYKKTTTFTIEMQGREIVLTFAFLGNQPPPKAAFDSGAESRLWVCALNAPEVVVYDSG